MGCLGSKQEPAAQQIKNAQANSVKADAESNAMKIEVPKKETTISKEPPQNEIKETSTIIKEETENTKENEEKDNENIKENKEDSTTPEPASPRSTNAVLLQVASERQKELSDIQKS